MVFEMEALINNYLFWWNQWSLSLSIFLDDFFQLLQNFSPFSSHGVLDKTRNGSLDINIRYVCHLCAVASSFQNESCSMDLGQFAIFVQLNRKFATATATVSLVSDNSDCVDSHRLSVWYRSWQFHDVMDYIDIVFGKKDFSFNSVVLDFFHEKRIWEKFEDSLKLKIECNWSLDEDSVINLHWVNNKRFLLLYFPVLAALEGLHFAQELFRDFSELSFVGSLHLTNLKL